MPIAYFTFGLRRAYGDRTMPKFPFSCDLRTVFGRRRVVVASTILFNSELYTKKNRRNVARRHVVGASHDPRADIARWSHGDRAEYARFLLVVLEQKNRTMTVSSCDDRTPSTRLSQGRNTVPVQCP